MFHMLFKGLAVYHEIIEVNNNERVNVKQKNGRKLQKVAGALVRPKGITRYLNAPYRIT